MKKLLIFLSIISLQSCKSDLTKSNIVEDTGAVVVKNGRDLPDTINYTCIGCKSLLTPELFTTIQTEATKKAKNNLNNPLSFIPVSQDITIIELDSLINFETGKKIDSVLSAVVNYSYIGKNAYGTEMGGEQLIYLYLVSGQIKDLSNEIKLQDLKFNDKYINRTLFCSKEDEFIELIPTKDKSIIINSSLGCVDIGANLILTLQDGSEVKILSWNDFNCEGKSYFNPFSQNQVQKLKSSPIKYIHIYSRSKSQLLEVPKNQSDYLQQFFGLF